MTQKGGPRSQAARDRIVGAARHVFAADGYERATVRVIAAEALVAPAMVIRYFGSKEGLFAAAVDFSLDIPDLRELPQLALGPALVGHFLDRWESADRRGDLAALLRASGDHDAARERLITIFSDQLVGALRAVADQEAAERCAGLISTQMIGLAFCRYVLRLPAVASMPSAFIVQTIGATVQQYLELTLAPGEQHGPAT